jgi:hypothetical protein
VRADWAPLFLGALEAGSPIAMAARFAGVARRTVYDRRTRDQRFAEAWDRALDGGRSARIVRRTHHTKGAPGQLAARVRAVAHALRQRELEPLADELGDVARDLDGLSREHAASRSGTGRSK